MEPRLATEWHNALVTDKYVYNFTWFGRQVYQEPQDIMALQQIIFSVKPDLIIETGIAQGGSLIFSASMLALLDMERKMPREVIGVDIDIRDHTVKALKTHPLSKYIRTIEGDSTDPKIVEDIRRRAKWHSKVLVYLDSNHTHNHVLAELNAYAPLVSPGSYCVVFDTGIEDLPKELVGDRVWGKGNNPKTAVWEYLKHHPEFEPDTELEQKLLCTSAPDGWLKRK